jgi:hypothetical protein
MEGNSPEWRKKNQNRKLGFARNWRPKINYAGQYRHVVANPKSLMNALARVSVNQCSQAAANLQRGLPRYLKVLDAL